MSEEKEKRYTCANSLCPCMELAIIKERQMKNAREVGTGKKLGTIYYFTETEVEEANWDQSGYDECEHIEVEEGSGIPIKPIAIALAAAAVLGGGGWGASQLVGGVSADPHEEAQEIISGAIDPLFAK